MKQQFLQTPAQFLSHFFSPINFNLTNPNLPILDIQYQLLQYLNVFLNFISLDNLYINTIIISFPVFAGSIALFNIFYELYKKPLPAFCTLLLPSVLFWTSELYKDGLLYAAIGYFVYLFLKQKKLTFKTILLLLFCCIIILASRTNTMLTFLPAILFLMFTEKMMVGRKKAILLIMAITVLFIIAGNYMLHEGLLYHICERQKNFHSLTGGSRMYLPVLEPTLKSLLSVFPIALFNGFFQPLPGTGGKFIYTAFAIEQIAIWIIVFYGIYLMIKRKKQLSNFEIACLLFVLPGLIICGYIIPFAGAIIRYRSIYLPFLIVPFLNIISTGGIGSNINNWLDAHIMVKDKTAS
ncbi:MAG: hypothetical protein QM726_20685 [Chitinophagaceae bacterium]